MSQDERRHTTGRRGEDFEAPALRSVMATHEAMIHRMRTEIAALERDVERVMINLIRDPQVDLKLLRTKLGEIDQALRELLL